MKWKMKNKLKNGDWNSHLRICSESYIQYDYMSITLIIICLQHNKFKIPNFIFRTRL